MNMKTPIARKTIIAAVISCAIFSPPRGASAEAIKKQLTFGGHFDASGSVGSSQFKEFHDIMAGIAAGQGVAIVSKLYKTSDEVIAAFLANRIDVASLWPVDMPPIWDKNAQYSIWGTYTVANKPQRSFCLWQLKTRGQPSAEDFAKSALIKNENSILYYIMLRDFLYTRGIDKPVWKTFKSIARVPSQNAAFAALTTGKGDFFWDSDDWDSLLKILNSGQAAKVKHTLCSGPVYSRSGIVINRKTVSKPTYEFLINISKGYTGDNFDAYLKTKPELQSFRQKARVGKIQIVLGDARAYAAEKALYARAKKNGWLGEARFFAQKFEKIPSGETAEIKSDLPYCKSSCASSKSKEKCIIKCMNE